MIHKEIKDIWWIEDHIEFETLTGFTLSEYSDCQNPDSFASKIKRSPRFNRFGKFNIYNNYWVDNYTKSKGGKGGILIHGYLYLLFEL